MAALRCVLALAALHGASAADVYKLKPCLERTPTDKILERRVADRVPLVDESVYEGMQAVVPKCTSLIHTCNAGDGAVNKFACQSAFIVCNMGLT